MKALILAAGEGTRLEPLTNVRPKPMLPVANKPLLEYVIEAVIEAGISEIVLVVGYKRQRIQDYFGDGDRWNVDVSYVFQDPQLGTGDAILQAKSIVEDDFVVLNGDRIFESDVITAVVESRQQTGVPTMAVTPVDEPSLYGVVEADESGVLQDIEEKPSPEHAASNQINAGVYAFGPEIFSAIERTNSRGELAITATLDQMRDSLCPEIVNYDGDWFDVSRPWDLIRVNGRILDHEGQSIAPSASVADSVSLAPPIDIDSGARIESNVTLGRGTTIGANVSVGANSYIENSIVFPDTAIAQGVILKDVIVGQNVTIGPGTVVEGGNADVVVEDTLHRDVLFGGILGDNATLGANVTVSPGTRLGNDATVASACVLDGDIQPGTRVESR